MFIKERGKVDEGKDKKVKKRGKNNIKCSLKLRQTRTLKLRQVEAIKKCKKKNDNKRRKNYKKNTTDCGDEEDRQRKQKAIHRRQQSG